MASKQSKSFSIFLVLAVTILIHLNLLFGVSSTGTVQISLPDTFCVNENETWHKPCETDSNCSINCWDYTKCDPVEKLCICLEEDKMYYDNIQNTCVVYANSACTSYTVTGHIPCTEGATCVKAFPDDTCKCDNGIPPEEGLCVKSHFEECIPEHHHTCSKEKGLICDKGNCTCVQEGVTHAWSTDENTCLGLADVGTCTGTERGTCIHGAYCAGQTCRCLPGFSATSKHFCKLSVNSTCYQNPTEDWETCNEDAGLICSPSICSCLPGTVYDVNNERCAAAVKQPCDLKAPFKRNCVPGSKCVENGTTGQGICECEQGYSPVEDNSSCVNGGNSASKMGLSPAILTVVTVLVAPCLKQCY